MSGSQANELYRHAETNNTILRTISYALPAALQAQVQTVVPTTYFGSESPRTLRKTPRMHPGGAVAVGAPRGVTSRDYVDNYVEPEYLRWPYYSIGYVPRSTNRNMIGVTGYHGEYPSPTDLRLFIEKYRPDGLSATYSVIQINGGGYDPSTPGDEPSISSTHKA